MPRTTKDPCSVCYKCVRNNQKGLFCDSCNLWIHLSCTTLTVLEYDKLSLDPGQWFCFACLQTALPFSNVVSENEFFNLLDDMQRDTQLNFSAPASQLTSNSVGVNNDLDPDCFIGPANSTYYDVHDFNSSIVSIIEKECLSYLHINARSVNKNMDAITTYLQSLKMKFSIIVLTETWCVDDSMLFISGYNVVAKHRSQNRRGGGVAIFISSDLSYRPLTCVPSESSQFESVFVELLFAGQKSTIVCGMYRPPNTNKDEFVKYLDIIFNDLTQKNVDLVLAGDYNLDLIQAGKSHVVDSFLHTIYSHNCSIAIDQPTRVTTSTSTLLDNIIFSNSATVILSGILLTDISDHLPVFCIMNSKKRVSTSNSLELENAGYRIITDDRIALF